LCCVFASAAVCVSFLFFFFSSRRRHTRSKRDWSSDVCSSDLDHAVFMLAVQLFRPLDGAAHPLAPLGEHDLRPERRKQLAALHRSEERRVGKECRSRWAQQHGRKKKEEKKKEGE